ncbi:transmembrane protein 102 [Tachyglossus aculeatus]|uniref:transmembrane protein 102 n=1 Tax=Tachyglossus aculeatus TaxID=9261 RepID=UPI0018F6B0CF|nr:transmembrane protein 102 [Tachyglossus aculeatus]
MASGGWGVAPWWGPPPPAPARPLTDIDFCSGAQLRELTQLIQELGVQESWAGGPQAGPDLIQAKDFVFSLLSVAHGRDPRFPARTELLLLRGGVRDGSVDLGPGRLGTYARGPHYDAAFTLLVPVLGDEREAPRVAAATPGHHWLRLTGTAQRTWRDCLACGGPPLDETPGDAKGTGPAGEGTREHVAEADDATLCPALVAAWFFSRLTAAAAASFPAPGGPRLVHAARHGAVTTLLLATSTPPRRLLLYDLVPAVALPGRPRGARALAWAGEPGPEPDGYYLVPGPAPRGPWRLCFARQELRLKARVPPPLLQAHAAAQAVLRPLAAGNRGLLLDDHRAHDDPAGSVAYLLKTLLYWACERLPGLYLARPENAAACCLGLLDELARCLQTRELPHYFLQGWDLLGDADADASGMASELARARAEPVGALRAAVEGAKAARKGGGVGGLGAP